MAIVFDNTVARPVTYSGAINNVAVEAKAVTLTGITLNGGAAGSTFKVFDNATTNSGTIMFAATLGTGIAQTYEFPYPLSALNGITINASAAGGAGAIYARGGTPEVYTKSISGATGTNVVATATGGGKFFGFSVNASNTGGASTISFFDNATASSGTLLYSLTIPTQTAANTQIFNLPTPVLFANGITASIATTAVGDISLWVG
jgi:hypothetical protein